MILDCKSTNYYTESQILWFILTIKIMGISIRSTEIAKKNKNQYLSAHFNKKQQ